MARCMSCILKLLQPRKSVVLMMDGPAPRAKLLTQRARRADKAKRSKIEIDTALLSPGTPMMARVRNAVVYLICSRLQSQKYADVVFFFSGPGAHPPPQKNSHHAMTQTTHVQHNRTKRLSCVVATTEVAGEGETKVQERLLAHAAADATDTHCCFGSDADLILQSIAGTVRFFCRLLLVVQGIPAGHAMLGIVRQLRWLQVEKVSICLNFQKQDYLLDVNKLVQRVYGQRPGEEGPLSDVELSGARADFALLSLFMGNGAPSPFQPPPHDAACFSHCQPPPHDAACFLDPQLSRECFR